jgi:glutathione S-transferase
MATPAHPRARNRRRARNAPLGYGCRMILIGQYDSPFVRRVAIALRLYDMPFEQRPLSAWSNADELARVNPLRRVPVLVLPDGLALVESAAILDELDQRAPDEKLLLPRTGSLRTRGLRVCAFATGYADKAVSLLYERLIRDEPSARWVDRCQAQMFDTLDMLERELRSEATPYVLGDALSHADIALACALLFTNDAHPGLLIPTRWPTLFALVARVSALPVFAEIHQPLVVNSR